MITKLTPHMTDYEAERRNFHLDVPEYFNFASDVIGKWANDPHKLAMLWVGQRGETEVPLTFATLGIKKGDIVMVMLPRIPEWWEVVLGLMKPGAVAIPCTTHPELIRMWADYFSHAADSTETLIAAISSGKYRFKDEEGKA